MALCKTHIQGRRELWEMQCLSDLDFRSSPKSARICTEQRQRFWPARGEPCERPGEISQGDQH